MWIRLNPLFSFLLFVCVCFAVKYTCYNAQSKLSQVQWIPNAHYSGVFGLAKLLYPDILPSSLNQVIVLDSDLTFLCDVAELWSMFQNMTEDKVRFYK